MMMPSQLYAIAGVIPPPVASVATSQSHLEDIQVVVLSSSDKKQNCVNSVLCLRTGNARVEELRDIIFVSRFGELRLFRDFLSAMGYEQMP